MYMIDPSGACRRINDFRTNPLISRAQLKRLLEMKYTSVSLQILTLDASRKRTSKISNIFLNSIFLYLFPSPKNVLRVCDFSIVFTMYLHRILQAKLQMCCEKNNRLYLRAAKELGAHIHRF